MLMSKKIRYIIGLFLLIAFVSSCEKDFDIVVPANKTKLVVEGYINNEMPLYNYVVLTRSMGFDTTNLNNLAVTGAKVFITEGDRQGSNIIWNVSTKIQLKEARIPQISPAAIPGIYFDTVLATDPQRALRGKIGKQYLLEIEVDGKQYSAITALLQTIPIDSLTSGNYFKDEENDTIITKARLTVHFQDPDTIGNAQLYYWHRSSDGAEFGWGAFGRNRFIPGTDDLVNGQYIHLTHPSGFILNDTVKYYMANVERNIYNFWDSYNKARENGGPFSTPVKLNSTIKGEDVIGCFSGFGMSTRTIIVK